MWMTTERMNITSKLGANASRITKSLTYKMKPGTGMDEPTVIRTGFPSNGGGNDKSLDGWARFLCNHTTGAFSRTLNNRCIGINRRIAGVVSAPESQNREWTVSITND